LQQILRLIHLQKYAHVQHWVEYYATTRTLSSIKSSLCPQLYILYHNSFVIHETWSRDEKELWNKINNWGHRDDFNKESYYNLWLSLDKFNFKHLKNFHPIENNIWPALLYGEGNNINEFIDNVQKTKTYKTNKLKLFFTNNRNWQRLKSLYRKILK